MSGCQYDAFISYRHVEHDMAVAKKLHTLLENYHIPAAVASVCGKKKMGKIFRDEEELPLAVSLSENIEAALDASEWLIVICSPDLLESRWCMREIDYFISKGRRDHILLVLARGGPAESFPLQLTRIETEDGSKDVEPLAANIASDKVSECIKKLGIEKLRILAPMLGVGFDDLRRRARQRRIRITAGIAAAVLAAAVGVTAYVGVQNRKKAELRVGELIEKAESYRAEGERIFAAGCLLDALDQSKKAGNYRSADIESSLQRTLYMEPFTKISGFSGQSIRFLDSAAVPDGRYVLGIVNNNSVGKLDCLTGKLEFEVSVSNSQIRGLEISPDGRRFLAQTEMAKSVAVWNTKDGSLAFIYGSKAGKEYQIANAFFIDSDTIVVQDMDKFYKVRSDGTETLIYTLGDYKGSYDPEYNFLTELTGQSIKSLINADQDDYLGVCAAVSADRSRMVIGGKDGSFGVVIIDMDGRVICELDGMPGVFSDTYYFTPDGRNVACTSMFNYFGLWDAESGAGVFAFTVHSDLSLTSFSNVVFSPDSKIMAFVADYYLYAVDTQTAGLAFGGNIDQTNITPHVSYSKDGSMLFLRDQSLFIIGGINGGLIDILQAESSAAYNNCLPVLEDKGLFVTQNDGSAAVLAMPEIASVRASASYEKELASDINKGYSFNGGQLQSEHQISDAYKASAAAQDFTARLYCSADGRYACLAHADGVLEVFDEKDKGKVSRVISEYQTRVSGVSLAASTLAACGNNGKLLTYDIRAGSIIKIWNTGIPMQSVILSPSGEYLMALCSSGDQIDVYHKEKGLLFGMDGSAGFTDMAFSKDGTDAVGIGPQGYVVGSMLTDQKEMTERARLLCGR